MYPSKNVFYSIIYGRLILFAVFLGIDIWTSGANSQAAKYIIPLLPIIVFLTFLYHIGYTYKFLRSFIIIFQFLADIFIVLFLIYTNGIGSEKYFIIFILIVFIIHLVLNFRYGILFTSLIIVLFSSMYILMLYNILPPFNEQIIQENYVYMRMPINMMLFFVLSVIFGRYTHNYRLKEIALKTAINSLEQKNIDTNTILENLVSGVITIDSNGDVIYQNKTAVRFLKERIINENIMFIDSGKEMENFYKPLREAFMKKNSIDAIDIRINNKVFNLSFTPFLYDSIFRGGVVFFVDITKEIELQVKMELANQLLLINQLAASFSHEIRNPLSAIRGAVQTLKKGLNQEDEDIADLMDIVIMETDRINKIIADFLVYGQKKEIVLESFDFRILLCQVVKLISKSEFFKKGFEIENNIPEDLNIVYDKRYLKQILYNIIINSLQAMRKEDKGKIILELSEENDKFYIISLKDNGTGINDEDLKNIFTPFFTTKAKGSGLGLSIVRNILYSMESDIKLKNREDDVKGAQVILYLRKNLEKELDSNRKNNF